MTNSSKSLKVLPEPSSRFQGHCVMDLVSIMAHGIGSWMVVGYCIIHIPGMFLWCLGSFGTSQLWCVSYLPYIYLLPNLEIYLNVEWYRTCYIWLGSVFRCEFNCDACFAIRLTYYGNFRISTYVYAFCIKFQCEFTMMPVLQSD